MRLDYWGSYATTADLPNVSGAAVQSAQVLAGHHAYVVATTSLYVCTTATPGAGVWSQVGSGSSALVVTSTASTTPSLAEATDTLEIDSTAGNVVLTLPVPTLDGKRYLINKISADTNTITLDPSATYGINGGADNVNMLLPGSAGAGPIEWTLYPNITNTMWWVG